MTCTKKGAQLVSIVIPTFNSAAYVLRALESATGQTHRELEIILVDNASRDNTLELCAERSARDRRIRVLPGQANVGPWKNWLRGVEAAQGSYIGLLFSDDWYEPNFVETLLTPLVAGAPVAFSAVRLWRENREPTRIGFVGSDLSAGAVPSDRLLRGWLTLTDVVLPSSPACALFQAETLKSALRRVMPTYGRFGAERHGAGPDVMTFLQAAGSSEAVYYDPTPRVWFRSHASNLSNGSGIAAAYVAARCDYWDVDRPLCVSAREHHTYRAWCAARYARSFMRRAWFPRVELAEVDWGAIGRRAKSLYVRARRGKA